MYEFSVSFHSIKKLKIPGKDEEYDDTIVLRGPPGEPVSID
jgi:hypothetical protein